MSLGAVRHFIGSATSLEQLQQRQAVGQNERRIFNRGYVTTNTTP